MLKYNQLFEQEKDFKVDTEHFRKAPSQSLIDEVTHALREKGHEVTIVEDESSALDLIKKVIPSNATVMSAGSVTLDEIGFKDFYFNQPNDWVNLHKKILAEKDPLKQEEARRNALNADYFLSSVCAISKDGDLFVADATGTRTGGFLAASKRVIVVAGINKLVNSEKEGLDRTYNFCFPCESVRSRFAYKNSGSQVQNYLQIRTGMLKKYHIVLVKNTSNTTSNSNHSSSLFEDGFQFIKPTTKNFSQLIYDKPLRRVLFNVPGSDRKKIEKAVLLSDRIDSIVLDIEDGVAINKKQEARDQIKKSVVEDSYQKSELLVRVNSIDSGLLEKDLEMIAQVATYIDGLVIPKVEHPDHLGYLMYLLHRLCGEKNASHLNLLACVESAVSLVNLKDICRYHERLGKGDKPSQLQALVFASEDYCADTGITRTPSATELLYARSTVVNHAVAHGLQAIDMVCINFRDPDVLAKETKEGIQLGFHGKQAIHPNQIDIICDAFRPSPKQFEFATKIVEQNELNQSQGKGAFEIDGKMIDMPMVKWANNILSIESFYPKREENDPI
eukprot:gene5418-6757_t